jgi:hypothetical protein
MFTQKTKVSLTKSLETIQRWGEPLLWGSPFMNEREDYRIRVYMCLAV